MLSTIVNTLLVLTAKAFAAPQITPYACTSERGYYGLSQTIAWQDGSDPKYGWQMMAPETVTSDEEVPASLTATYTEGISVTITEGLNLGFNMYVEKLIKKSMRSFDNYPDSKI